MNDDADALVIGGGPAGAALAHALAVAGRSVLVIEREPHSHHKVCGEFISAEAMLYLHDLGVHPSALGATPIDAVRLCVGARAITSPLPFTAFSLSRRALDEAILGAAAAAGAMIRRARATRLVDDGGTWRARLDNGAVVSAPAAFIATGKHDLRGWRRPPGTQADLIGFKMYWRLDSGETAALARHVEIIPFVGGYAGLQLVEGGDANLCLVVRQRAFATAGRRWDALLATIRSSSPHLDRRLRGATQCWERPLSIWPIPYGHVSGADDGSWRLGDQAAVIPSFSGDGIAIALHSARLAGNYHAAGRPSSEFQARFAADVAGQIRRATWLSQMLVHPAGQASAAALRFMPGLLAIIAQRTRIDAPAVRRARQALPLFTALSGVGTS